MLCVENHNCKLAPRNRHIGTDLAMRTVMATPMRITIIPRSPTVPPIMYLMFSLITDRSLSVVCPCPDVGATYKYICVVKRANNYMR